MRYLLLPTAALLLTACTDPEIEEEMISDGMRPAVQEVVAKEYPLVSSIPVVDCIIEHADDDETTRILQASIEGVTGRDSIMIQRIVNRSETQGCISDAGVPLGLM